MTDDIDSPAPLPPDVREHLRDVGLHYPDPKDPLHRRLVDALLRTRGSSWGNQLVAMKFEFNWEHVAAGKEFAQAKTDYEHRIDVETVRLMANPAVGSKPMSRAQAEQTARASDASYQLQLKFLLAEKREQSMRKFLDTLSSALDNHRTDRADQRAGDQAHKDGIGGGA